MEKKKIVMGAALGNCVHVGGIVHFLQLAEDEGYETAFLGPAVPVESVVEYIEKHQPDIVGVGYRLTPENGEALLKRLIGLIQEKGLEKRKWVFGGTKPVAEVARKFEFFDFISDGTDDIDDSVMFLRGKTANRPEDNYPDNLVERVDSKYPYPLLRHHYGRPSLEETIEGIGKIAEAKVMDVISLGPDQNTQEFFFRQQEMKKEYDGAGGVPIRSEEDFRRLKEASRRGNFPLMRSYSGTSDVFDMAETLKNTINNAWCAVPLCWYNELDGRGTRTIEVSVAEAQRLMKWHADRGIPVEANEPHHWALRDAHDTMSVVMAYVSAYNAKKMGVKHYISQFMMNVPNTLSFPMDLARVLAMRELVETLEDENFRVFRQTRAGLPFLCADYDVAKGQLAASTMLQMSLAPHIIHVVGFCEADHAASAEEVIESCRIVRGVIRSVQPGNVAYQQDLTVNQRKQQLKSEAEYLISYIRNTYQEFEDPLANPVVIADCIKRGVLDAPHILKGGKFHGDLETRVLNGKCVAYNRNTGKEMNEEERLAHLDSISDHVGVGA